MIKDKQTIISEIANHMATGGGINPRSVYAYKKNSHTDP